MSVPGVSIAKGGATLVAAVSGLIGLRCAFSGVGGGGFKILSGEFSDIVAPMLSQMDVIGPAAAVSGVAVGVRVGLGKLFPEPKQL